MHSQDHADSEYIILCGEEHKGAQFIGNKQTNKLTYRHLTSYISTDSTSISRPALQLSSHWQH